MSEKLLKALMELFAIIANLNNKANKGREIVKVFLKRQLNIDAIDEYLHLFDFYFDKHADSTETKKTGKHTPVSHSVKALVICSQVNEELTQQQKMIIVVRLLEFVKSSKKITEEENDFISTVALAFNIEDSEFAVLKEFVLNDDVYSLDYPNLLIIDNAKKSKINETKHLYKENLSGSLCFLFSSTANIYMIKYLGNEELYLNGQLLQSNQIFAFVNGSTLRNAKIETIYYSDIISQFVDDDKTSKIIFSAEEVEYHFQNNKVGLHPLNISEESGKIIGIMGVSGSGKTTLLNVLCGLEKPINGKISINGIDIYEDKKKVEGVLGYVPQDDILMEELTVYQNLYYNAKLCFGNLKKEKIEELVIKVLQSLGLLEIKDLTVGSILNRKISGGQRKRLNIGLELIREPAVLFLDEPTSGLSSRDSENIMDLLKELTLKGKLIFVVIHQPSSDIYKLFDKLVILDEGGYEIYYGNPIDAIIYFKRHANYIDSDKSECRECGNVNPEQIFNIIEAKMIDEYGRFTENRKVSPKRWYKHYNDRAKQYKLPPIDQKPSSTLKIPKLWKQIAIFIKRDVLTKLSNLQYMLITFTEAPILAFILAYLLRFYSLDEASIEGGYNFSNNNNILVFIFISVIVALFLGMTQSAEEIIKDQKILKRESFLNLSRFSYLFSKMSILFVISAIQMFSYVIIGNFILEIKDMTFAYWLILFSTAFFANMLGLNISSSFNSVVTVYILIPIFLIPQILLSGAVVKFDKLNPKLVAATHVPLVGDLLASKWAFEAITVNQFKNNRYEKNFYTFDKIMSKINFKIDYLIPELIARLDYLDNNIPFKSASAKHLAKQKLNVIRNEFTREQLTNNNIKFDKLDLLTINKFNKQTAYDAKEYILKLRQYYLINYNHFSKKKEIIIKSLINDFSNTNYTLINLKKDYYNTELEEFVRNVRDEKRIIEYNEQLIQKIDPIFEDPNYHNKGYFDIRAHLFAPTKHFFGNLYETFYVNMIILWIMSVILFITLYYDLLRKAINYKYYHLFLLIKKK